MIYHDVKIRHIKKNYISKKITKKNPLNDLILNGNKIILSSSAIKKKFITEKILDLMKIENLFLWKIMIFGYKLLKIKEIFFI